MANMLLNRRVLIANANASVDAESIPILGLNFATNEYTENGDVIASPLTLIREATAWTSGEDGVTITAYGANVPRFKHGLYLERERTRYSTYPTDQVNWSIVSSATRTADTAIGLLTPVIIGSGGSTASMLSSNTNISFTAGQKVFPVEVYKAGTSGRNRLRISNAAALTSTLIGTSGEMIISDSGAGAWSDLSNVDMGDWSKVEATFTAGTTEAGYRLREGPDSAVGGQTVVVAWSQIASLPGEIILGPQNTAATVPQDQAFFDISSYNVTGTIIKFKANHFVTNATILNIEDSLGTSAILLNVTTDGTITAILMISGIEVASALLGTINSNQEYTVGIEWYNNVLSAYINDGIRINDNFVGTMPPVTLVELFPSGGSNITIPTLNLYNRII